VEQSEKARPYTVADFLAISEEERFHELIDGELVPLGPFPFEHGAAVVAVASKLVRAFGFRPGAQRPGGWWLVVGVDLLLDENMFRPDVVGWRRDRVPERPAGSPIAVRPDWVCEVLSTNKRNDLVKKKRTYHRVGVPHYWIVDPDEETLSVNRWTADGYVEVLGAERGERVHAEPFDAIEIAVGVFFGDDDE
jgi:Uma2 family endonuclease